MSQSPPPHGRQTLSFVDPRTGRPRMYRLERKLGEGASGDVFKATWIPDDAASADQTRPVALKVCKDMKWKGRLAHEAQLLREVAESHAAKQRELATKPVEERVAVGMAPNRVVKVGLGGTVLEEALEEPESPIRGRAAAIELEYLEGTLLTEWMNRQRQQSTLAPTDKLVKVVRIGIELCEALQQLRDTKPGIVHRDLKPDNLMMTDRGLRVFDLNVAGELDHTRDTRVGTRTYMAPEVELGQAHDHRADHYSLGVLLFELLMERRLDALSDCNGYALERQLVWPPKGLPELPAELTALLADLLCGLVCPPGDRIANIQQVRAVLNQIHDDIVQRSSPTDALATVDMITLLAELRPSGLVSVVADTKGHLHAQSLQDEIRRRMQVEDPLEEWLVERMEDMLTEPNDERPVLLMLSGNAGDGKSHLIDQLLKGRLAARPDLLERIDYIADATHAHSPNEDQRSRLQAFFAPFQTGAAWDRKVRLIAMNTGMVINFFEGEQESGNSAFAPLYRILQQQLGLAVDVDLAARPPFRVDVVNLDLRNLVDGRDGTTSFLERMLDRLRVGSDADHTIPSEHWSACASCPAFHLCPVAFNLRALGRSGPRRALLALVRRASLDAEVHLSPRNLWGFLYRVMTGGLERYANVKETAGEQPCDVVRRKVAEEDGKWLLAGQFSEALFQQPGAGRLWDALIRHDPAFSSAPHIDKLHTKLSIRSELDADPEMVERNLGGKGQSLEGLSLGELANCLPDAKDVRRDAAVRRQFFFHAPTYTAWEEQEGSRPFVALLGAYERFSRGRLLLSPQQQDHLSSLNGRLQRVFQYGHGRRLGHRTYLQVSRPNVRSESELLVEASDRQLSQIFSVIQILERDPHVVAHTGRLELLDCLGYRPVTVQLKIAGVRLVVDLDLYDFLRRVEDGQKPSQRDLAQFQALVFVGERIGNQVSSGGQPEGQVLYVYSGNSGELHGLRANEWGQVRMTRVDEVSR